MAHIQTQAEWEEEMSKKILTFVWQELYFDLRFLEPALSAFTYKRMDGLLSFATDGMNLYFSTEWLLRVFEKNSAFLNRAYLHTVFHCLFRQLWQVGNRNVRLFNIACDIAVEYTIDSMDKGSTKRILSWIRTQMYDSLKKEETGVSAAILYRRLSTYSEEKIEALGRVIDTLDILRVKCPWDAKQTNESLRPNTIEEVYELCDALINSDDTNIRKELGDVLLHVLFYAKIGEEKEAFDIADVCDALNTKLIFRHPHVFGDTDVNSTDDVLRNWEELKLKEKGGNKTVLSGVPAALPAMIKADRIQEKASNVGFDWERPEQVWDKVREEMAEFEETVAEKSPERMEEEMGDLLFSVINAARLYKINPENALEKTNKKFIARFNHLEKRAHEMGKELRDMTLAEMDSIWEEAKNL